MTIKNIAVLGTGTMGSTIAIICLNAGLNCTVYGRSDKSIEKANAFIANEVSDKDLINNITFVKDFNDLKGCDFLIEALAENLEIKQNLFKELDFILNKDIVLTTTTSGLSPSEIAKDMKNPERFAVAHFWNPAHLIPLVEVVPGEMTSKETIQTTASVMKLLGKEPVEMEKECLGFIGNRIQLAMLREALHIVEEGYATVENVDKAIECSLGRRMAITGPFKSCDMGGVDIFNNVSKYLFKDLCDNKDGSKLLDSLATQGKLGSKTGEGFYKWPEETLAKVSTKRNTVLNYFNDLED